MDMKQVANSANPPSPVCSQWQRWGDFFYTITHLNKGQSYAVRLHFFEPSKWGGGKTNPNAAPVTRKFHVEINGKRVLADYDVAADAGADVAVVKEFEAVADKQGKIKIEFISSVAKAFVNAIEVRAKE